MTIRRTPSRRSTVELELQALGGEGDSPVLLDFIVGPGNQGLRMLGNVAVGLLYTIELVIVDRQLVRG
jgi:hypothetical protein